uniref:Uncharacterized protein zm10orf1 n=1 Tax=Zymomonas mobilis TaxID=542 RepID=Q9XBT0_ZYMMB|nr:unknown protein [Zymomonas mobilis subsp. mobilis ZM4 = ATCC 31821]
MLNGMFDFGGKNDGVSGFIGGGVGVARVALNHYSLGGSGSFANDNDAHFAWQVIAGIRKPVTKMIDFELKYRFFNVNGLNFRTTDMGNMSGRYRSHSVLAGLVFNFGERSCSAAPPPMPAPPPPTPPGLRPPKNRLRHQSQLFRGRSWCSSTLISITLRQKRLLSSTTLRLPTPRLGRLAWLLLVTPIPQSG